VLLTGTLSCCLATQFTLATEVKPAGGTRLSINADAAEGYYFIGFKGCLAGLPNPQVLFITQNCTVTALFSPVAAQPLLLASTGVRTPAPTPRQVTIEMRLTDAVGAGPAADAHRGHRRGYRCQRNAGICRQPGEWPEWFRQHNFQLARHFSYTWRQWIPENSRSAAGDNMCTLKIAP
jgi:hypothetical protein